MSKVRVTARSPGIASQAGRALGEKASAEFEEVFERFILFDESIRIEFDSETLEARVIPVGE